MTALAITFTMIKHAWLFLDSVVGQVHIQVWQVVGIRFFIPDSTKPGKPVFEEIDPHRVDAVHQHIDPQIKLQSIDQVRVRDVLLHHIVLVLINLAQTLGEVDASPLTIGFRLHNECVLVTLLLLSKVLSFELIVVTWQDPGSREKSVVFWKLFRHLLQVST